MGEGACQRDISGRPSWRRELTYETIPISIGGSYLQLHWKVFRIFSMYVWESIGEKTLSTFLHSSWGRGRVNVIFQADLVGDVN